MPLLKFSYRRYRYKSPIFPKERSITRPVIPVRLINDDKHVDYYGLIDSGADLCLFHAKIGEIIGLNIKSGKQTKLFGLEGKAVAYFHNITINVGGWEYGCHAGFSYDVKDMPYGLLGQKGFFDRFIVNFDFDKEYIELRRKS